MRTVTNNKWSKQMTYRTVSGACVCDGCGKPQKQLCAGPVLRDHVWAKFARPNEWLCETSTPQRAMQHGVNLSFVDLMPCQFNLFHRPHSWFDLFIELDRPAPDGEAMKEWNELFDRPSFYEGIEGEIQRHGRSVICVGSEPESPAFAYTIGNQATGLPELLIIGTPLGALLNELSQKMAQRGCAFADGECVNLGGKFPVKIVNADQRAPESYTIQAGEFFGNDDYAVQQVLAPDRNGRFPDEPDRQPPYSTIPVLREH
jgi:Domain of unknown function (DUF4262)